MLLNPVFFSTSVSHGAPLENSARFQFEYKFQYACTAAIQPTSTSFDPISPTYLRTKVSAFGPDFYR